MSRIAARLRVLAGGRTADADRVLAGIDDIDWSSLQHAYGPAIQTPAMLRALLGGERERKEAVEFLSSALTHQGTVWSATAPATPFLLKILADNASQPVRAELLAVIEVIASAATYHDVHGPLVSEEDRESAEWIAGAEEQRAAVAASHMEAAKSLDAVLVCLADPSEAVRLQATSTVVAVALLQEAPEGAKTRAAEALSAIAQTDPSAVVRAAAVLSLGVFGVDTRGFLEDPEPEIRITAALSPTSCDNPLAWTILIDALARPAKLDAMFPDGLPQAFGLGKMRFSVLAALCDRIRDRSRTIPALLQVLELASPWTVDFDRAPILRYVFEGGYQGEPLTNAQHQVLEALVNRHDLWDPQNGNAYIVFKSVGLPYSREGISEVLASAQP